MDLLDVFQCKPEPCFKEERMIVLCVLDSLSTFILRHFCSFINFFFSFYVCQLLPGNRDKTGSVWIKDISERTLSTGLIEAAVTGQEAGIFTVEWKDAEGSGGLGERVEAKVKPASRICLHQCLHESEGAHLGSVTAALHTPACSTSSLMEEIKAVKCD